MKEKNGVKWVGCKVGEVKGQRITLSSLLQSMYHIISTAEDKNKSTIILLNQHLIMNLL